VDQAIKLLRTGPIVLVVDGYDSLGHIELPVGKRTIIFDADILAWEKPAIVAISHHAVRYIILISPSMLPLGDRKR